MSNLNYEKNITEQLRELKYALYLVDDSIQLVKEGKSYFLLPIYAQLRALILKSEIINKKGEVKIKNHPLLINLAEVVKCDCSIYCGAFTNDWPKEIPEPETHLVGFPITLSKVEKFQVCLNIDVFVKEKILKHKTKQYSIEEIIKIFANKFGGTHYDPTLDLEDYEIAHLLLGEVVRTRLVQVAQVIVDLGFEILRAGYLNHQGR